MHLLVALSLSDPGPLFRLCVLAAQGIFFNVFFVSYLVSPHVCHRFVGYIEEEAVITYVPTRLVSPRTSMHRRYSSSPLPLPSSPLPVPLLSPSPSMPSHVCYCVVH